MYIIMPRGRRTSAGSGNTIQKEVAALFALGHRADQTAMLRLRHKYGDDALVDAIQREFVMRHANVVRAAKKFAQAVRNKYAHTNTPYHMLLQKARRHAGKYKMSAAEFAEFQRMYEQELAGTNRKNEVVVPVTNMMKVLGNITTDLNGFVMKVSDDDARHLQEILNIARTSRPLHAQVMLQSMQYRDLDYEALTGVYSRVHNNKPGEHVHPVVAAMFFPRITTLEHHFLYANLAGIVMVKMIYLKTIKRGKKHKTMHILFCIIEYT